MCHLISGLTVWLSSSGGTGETLSISSPFPRHFWQITFARERRTCYPLDMVLGGFLIRKVGGHRPLNNNEPGYRVCTEIITKI